MPTVSEILRQTGLTDQQIAALDSKLVSGFTAVLSTAEQAAQEAAAERDRAEIERRSNARFYAESVAPALDAWGNEKAAKDAEVAFYRTQLESARTSGFVPTELPGVQPRDAQGRYVANAPGGTPGSPVFQGIDQLRNEVGGALGTLADLQWRHQKLFGEPMPISPTELVRRAEAVRMDPVSYAAREFKFAEREAELARKSREERDAKIRADAVAERDRHWAEKIGSNPDVRLAQSSRYADVARAVKAGERPDPLALNESQRKQATRQAIQQDMVEKTV